MLFGDASALRVELVDQFHNGIYSGTRYTFRWERKPPMAPFKFHGEHRKMNGPYPTEEDALPLRPGVRAGVECVPVPPARRRDRARGAVRFRPEGRATMPS